MLRFKWVQLLVIGWTIGWIVMTWMVINQNYRESKHGMLHHEGNVINTRESARAMAHDEGNNIVDDHVNAPVKLPVIDPPTARTYAGVEGMRGGARNISMLNDAERSLFDSIEENDAVVREAVKHGFGVVVLMYGEPWDRRVRDHFMFQAFTMMRTLLFYYPSTPIQMFVSPEMLLYRTKLVEMECLSHAVEVVALDVNAFPELSGHKYKTIAVLQSRFTLPLFIDSDVLPCPHSLRVLLREQLEHRYDIVAYEEPGRGGFHATAGQPHVPPQDVLGVSEEEFAIFRKTREINSGVLMYNMSSDTTHGVIDMWLNEIVRWATEYVPACKERQIKLREDTDQGPLRVALFRYSKTLHLGLTGKHQIQQTVFQAKDKIGCEDTYLFRHGSSYKYGDYQAKRYPSTRPRTVIPRDESMCIVTPPLEATDSLVSDEHIHDDDAEELEPVGLEWWDESAIDSSWACGRMGDTSEKPVVINVSPPLLQWVTDRTPGIEWKAMMGEYGWHHAGVVPYKKFRPGDQTPQELHRVACNLIRSKWKVTTPADAYSGEPWFLLYREFFYSFPGCKFVLYTMSEEDVWKMAFRFWSFRDTTFWQRYVFGECATPNENMQCRKIIIERYRAHTNAVREMLKDNPDQLLEIRIDTSSGDPYLQGNRTLAQANAQFLGASDMQLSAFLGEAVESNEDDADHGVEYTGAVSS